MTRLNRLEALEKTATPGPWANTSGEHHSGVSAGAFDEIYIADTTDSHENAALIAEARNLLPALIAASRALHMIAVYYGNLYVEGEVGYEAVIIARAALVPLLDEEDTR